MSSIGLRPSTSVSARKLVSGIMIRTDPIRFSVPEIKGYCVHVFEEIVIEYRFTENWSVES